MELVEKRHFQVFVEFEGGEQTNRYRKDKEIFLTFPFF